MKSEKRMHLAGKRKRRNDIVRDERGAIMVLGLFMALSLIGSLWFILGIGHAIFVRDRAIEAADHVAFSAAAVHARGMNFISALNLILFALTIIYVALCAVSDLLIVLGAVGGQTKWGVKVFGIGPSAKCRTTAAGVAEAIVAPEIAGELEKVAHDSCNMGHKLSKVAEKYNNDVLQGVFRGVSGLEKAVQVGMPIAAEVAAVTLAHDYDPYEGFALTGSIIPGISKAKDPGFGLPIRPQENKYLCQRAFVEVKKFVGEHVPPFVAKFVDFVIDKVEGKVMSQSPKDNNGNALGWPQVGGIGCDGGDPWSHSDIRVVSKTEGNGTDDFQIWGIVLNAKDGNPARAEERVSMSKHKGLVEPSQPARSRIYYSQAEYYFDCKGFWADDECYKDDDDAQRLASFSMKWRARLVRVYAPDFGSQMIGLATEFAMGGNLSNFIAGRMSEYPAARKLESVIAKLRNGQELFSFSRTSEGETMDQAINALNGEDKPIH